MSWKPAVLVNGDPKWSYNALRFETKEEAMASARDLMNRWLLVIAIDAHESDDPSLTNWSTTVSALFSPQLKRKKHEALQDPSSDPRTQR